MKKLSKILTVLLLTFAMLSPIFMTETVSAAPAESVPTGMHKIEDYFLGSFSPPEVTAVPNEPFDVSFTICPTIDAPDTTIRFIMPADLVSMVGGNAVWEGDVKKGETLMLGLSLVTQGEVEAYVRVNVESSSLDKNYRNAYNLHVVVPMTEEAQHLAKPISSASLLPTTRDPESPRAEITPQAPAGPGPTQIEIKGSWWYVNDAGGWSPGRYMLVWLRDDDTGTDEWVASQWTGANGEFDFIVENDDGFLQGGRDPYLEFYAEGEWDWKTTDTSGNQYHWSTGVLGTDVPGGWVKDVGSIAPGSSNNALMAGDAIFAEMNWVYWNSDPHWDRSKVTIRWPREDWPHSHGDYIDLPTSGWDHVTVQHEDGHCIMWTLYGNTWPNGWTGGSHWIGMEDTVQNAWTEGWAEFMEAAVDNNPNNLQGNGQNVESNDWFNWVDTGDMDGANIEGEVASILWDILDPVNIAGDNDHMAWGYDEIFTVLRYGDAGADDNPNSILEFWDDWASRWPTNSTSMGPLCDIYYHYGIDEDWYNPWGSISINAGASYTTVRTVTLTLSADDWGVGVQYMRFSEDWGVTWGGWYNYATTFSYTITSAGDGYKYVDVQFADFWWLSNGGTIYDGIWLDTTKPTGSISINSGAQYTTSRTVTLTLSGVDATSGVQYMRFSENWGAWGSWIAYATTYSYNLNSAGDGGKDVDVQFKDYAGLISTEWGIWDSIILDTTAPTGSIVVGSGNPTYTTTTSVTLYLTYNDATSGVYQVRYGNGGGSWSAWETPAATKAWTLISGDGSKSVWYQVKDNAGNICDQVGDYITLDTTPPTGSIIINSGAATTTTTSVTLSLTYNDATSGVYQVRYGNTGTWGAWEAPAATKAWTLPAGDGTKGVYYQIKDNAGLVSEYYDDIILQTPSAAYLVARGPNNAIYHRSYDLATLTWTDWTMVPGGATCDGPAATLVGNTLHMVVRGMEGTTLWYGSVTAGTFSGWTHISGNTPSKPTLVS
jgi:hypothetical protein